MFASPALKLYKVNNNAWLKMYLHQGLKQHDLNHPGTLRPGDESKVKHIKTFIVTNIQVYTDLLQSTAG